MTCGLLMLQLRRDWSAVRFVSPSRLLRRGASCCSALSAVEGDVRIIVYDDGLVIDIRDVGDIHVGHGPVVKEFAATPFAAYEAFTEVSKAVIDAAIESDVWAPIAGIPHIEAINPTPVSGSPQKAYFRR